MFAHSRLNCVYNLKGRYFRSFLVAVSEYLSLLLMLLSVLSSVYLLVFDTSLLDKLGIFSNVYIHISVCLFAVIENIALLFIYVYSRLYSKYYFTFRKQIRFRFVVLSKALALYFSLALRKMILFVLFSLPSAAFLFCIFYLSVNGISLYLLYILSAGLLLLFVSSLLAYFSYIQKYYLSDILICENNHNSIKHIISDSAQLMNGKCLKLFLLKTLNLPKRAVSLFILPALYFLPVCKSLETDFALIKENPYMQGSAHTEKSVVFYFKPIKEN